MARSVYRWAGFTQPPEFPESAKAVTLLREVSDMAPSPHLMDDWLEQTGTWMDRVLSDRSYPLGERIERAIDGLRERFEADAVGLYETRGDDLERVACSGDPCPVQTVSGARTALARRGGYSWSEIDASQSRLWKAEGLSIDTPIPGVDGAVGILSIFVTDNRLEEWNDPGRSNLVWLATRFGILLERRRATREASDTGHETERLLATQKLAELGRLSLAIAHDSNNLITAMAGSLQFIEAALEDEKDRTLAANGLDAYRMFGDMMRHLTDFSRDQRREPEILSIDEILSGTESLLQTQLRGSITLHLDLGAPNAQVVALRTQLTQALLNLASNAYDALEGKGTVTLRSSLIERDDRRWARIEFEDDGPGMGDEVRQRAFDPLFSTKAPAAGTGLGLPTVQQIIEELNGRISIQSEPGRGCRFEILLPARIAPSPLIVED